MLLSSDQAAEFENLLQVAESPSDLRAPCRLLTRVLGFDFYVFGTRIPQPSKSLQIVVSGLPEEWNTIYDERKFSLIDPLIVGAVTSLDPFTWDDIDWQDSIRVAEMRACSYRFGLNFGMTVPLHGPGAAVGIFNMARRDAPVTREPRARRELMHTAHLYATRAYIKMHELVKRDYVMEKLGLTDKERSVLSLAAAGFLVKQIAAEMGLTPRTVTGYITSLTDRFGAKTTKELLLRAAMGGMVDVVKFPEKLSESAAWTSEGIRAIETEGASEFSDSEPLP